LRFGASYQGDLHLLQPRQSPVKPDTISASVSLLFPNLIFPKGASVHTLRHRHSSHLLAAGVPLTDDGKRLGHVKPHVGDSPYALPGPRRPDRTGVAEVSEGGRPWGS
jgi:hypothetical protein